MKEDNLKNLVNRISKKANDMPIPISITFEITERCNLNCKFCYLGKKRNAESDMPLEKVLNIIDQLNKAGCMAITLLGGEPLIRNDFVQIYKYIKEKGFLITIFTNGTLVNEEIADLFQKYPPHHLRISIYAGSPKGYKRIAGDFYAFRKLNKTVKLLKRRKVNFTLRSLITKINFEEFEKMRKFAESLKIKFWARTTIASTATREFNPMKFKITPEQKNALLSKYGDRYIPFQWEDETRKRLAVRGCNGYYHIANDGRLLACALYRKKYSYDLNKMSFKQAYKKRLSRNITIKCPCL